MTFTNSKEMNNKNHKLKINKMVLGLSKDLINIIYSYLGLQDLKQLALTSKNLYGDELRKRWLIQRAVDACFYSERCFLGPIKQWNICYDKELFNSLIHERLERVGIHELQILNDGYIKVNNNGIIKIYDHFDKEIKFRLTNFLQIPLDKQQIIISNLIKFMYDLWGSAEKYNQNMLTSSCIPVNNYFPFFSLYKSIEDFLSKLFEKRSVLRVFIYKKLVELHDLTRSSKLYDHQPHGLFDICTFDSISNQFQYRYDSFDTISNQFNLKKFICYCGPLDYTDLDTILDICSWLQTNAKGYLYDYLSFRFDELIDLSNDEEHTAYDYQMFELKQELTKPYDSFNSKKDKLFSLFSSANYMIHDEMEKAIDYRWKRENGEVTSEEDDDEDEDDDY